MTNITDPFKNNTPDTSSDDLSGSVHDVPTSSFDKDNDVINRGMPKKNIKIVLIVMIGCALLASMLWPQSTEVKKPVQSEQAATEVETAKSIVASLENVQPQKPEPQQTNPDANKVQAPVFAPKNDPGQEQQNVLTEQEKKVMALIAREESIIASSMTPPDFSIKSKDRGAKSLPGETPLLPGDLSNTVAEAAREKDALTQTLMGAMNAQNQNQGQARRDPNGDFLKSSGESKIQSPDNLVNAPPDHSIFQGTIVKGILTNGINTQVPGDFKARVVSDIFDSRSQRVLLIPRGSIILGVYRSSILVGQSRMVLAAQRLILPNGKSINLRGTVVGDRSGIAGLPGEVDNHFWEMFKASAIIGAASLLLPRDQQQITTSTNAGGGQQTGGTILARSLNDVITRIAERNSSIGPTGSVDVGEIFTLMLQRDVAMEPYKW